MKKSLFHFKKILYLYCIVMIANSYSNTAQNKTAYAYDTLFPAYFQNNIEVPDRVVWIDKRLEEKDLKNSLVPVTPIDSPGIWIRKVHAEEHINGIQSIPVYTDQGATHSIGDIAVLAVAYILGAVDMVMNGKANNAFANIRPPGHHVVNGGYPAGFCAYANIVIAATYVREVYNINKILIVDWDYHYGNSTETFSCEDTNIFLAEFGSYANERKGCNKNKRHIVTYDVKEGTNEDFIHIFKDSIKHEMLSFKPELILISCGFDLKDKDALGSYQVTASGISALTEILMEIADRHCNGRIISVLEGGYDDAVSYPRTWYGLSQCAENHIRTLLTGKAAPETEFFIITPVLYRNIKRPVETGSNSNAFFNLAGRKIDPLNRFSTKQKQPAGMYIGIDTKGKRVSMPVIKK